jgi:hypothetical protein
MKRLLLLLLISACLWPIASRAESDSVFFFFDPHTDPLAPRDEYGLLHQMPPPNPTDFAPRYDSRLDYYFESGRTLVGDRAYVGALQVALYRNGYYCGPIDGIFSVEVSAAIARVQKNNSQTVTGTLTLGVRRALHLP